MGLWKAQLCRGWEKEGLLFMLVVAKRCALAHWSVTRMTLVCHKIPLYEEANALVPVQHCMPASATPVVYVPTPLDTAAISTAFPCLSLPTGSSFVTPLLPLPLSSLLSCEWVGRQISSWRCTLEPRSSPPLLPCSWGWRRNLRGGHWCVTPWRSSFS